MKRKENGDSYKVLAIVVIALSVSVALLFISWREEHRTPNAPVFVGYTQELEV